MCGVLEFFESALMRCHRDSREEGFVEGWDKKEVFLRVKGHQLQCFAGLELVLSVLNGI